MKALWIATTVLTIGLTAAIAGAAEMQLASEEWPPYSYMENGKLMGYCTEVIEAVMERIGIRPVISVYPWVRAEKMALEGKVDGLFSASRKPSREAVCHYPDEALFDSEYVFFIRREDVGKIVFTELTDIGTYRIGVTTGYSYSPEMWDFLKSQGNYAEAPTDAVNLKLLAKGRIDLFPAEKGNGITLLKRLDLRDALTYIDRPLIRKPYFIIFPKDRVDHEIVDRFSQELKSFKETGRFEAIRDKYLR